MNVTRHTAMGRGHEFETIRILLDVWGDVAVGIGDDAALLKESGDGTLVISTDACIENVHFRREWIGARAIGARACHAALSDLAAMGASATSILVSFVVPESWRDSLLEVAHGIGDAARYAGAKIVGGNLSRGAQFAIMTTVVGRCESPVLRSGAQPGDLLLVTGMLGGPASAIRSLEAGATPDEWAITRFESPTARLKEGQWLAASGVSAMIDVSDGLLADARHLAMASGVDVVIDRDLVPRDAEVSGDDAMRSGEEYELLVTAPAERAHRLVEEFCDQFDTGITVVGEVRAAVGQGSVAVRDANGTKADIIVEITAGHDHFSG